MTTNTSETWRANVGICAHVEDVEATIKIPISKWAGQCYSIAMACYREGCVPFNSKVAYGIFWGPISETKGRFKGRPFSHHAWIELPDKRIWDPTRWAFLDEPSFIWIGTNSDQHYDLGGLRARQRGDCPIYCGPVEIPLTGDQAALLAPHLPTLNSAGLDLEQVQWLAHQPPDYFKGQAAPVYQCIIDAGRIAVIPIDLRNYVLGHKHGPTKKGAV